MFYNDVVALDKNKHKDLKLDRSVGLTFAKSANSVAVAGFEFFEASRSYPIFFVNREETYFPIAVLSFRKEGHELGDASWPGVYVPAYMRRYPFMLSTDGVVVVDQSAEHLKETEGEALFTGEGEPSDFLKKHIEFLKVVDQGFKLTEEFCKSLAEKDLFKLFEGKVSFRQGEVNLGEVYVIDEKKMHADLNEAEVYEWFNKGWIAWSHAHLHSVGSLGEVMKRAVNAANASAAAAKEAETEQA